MNTHSIGKTIATLRKKKGWTQVELAEKLSVSDKTISKWESEAGLPEISQLPALANLFDVTIDYLMTGKAPSKKVITISKAKLCAKNDDVSLAKKVKNLPKDGSGKDIVDYIVKYKSLNVFKTLCATDPKFIVRFPLIDAIVLAVLSNSLQLLSGKVFPVGSYRFTFENENEIKSLLPIEDAIYFREGANGASCILPRSFFTMLVTDKRIDNATMDSLLSPQNNRECVWYHAFPYMIEEAYKNGNNELLQRLLKISKNNNDIAYRNITVTYNSYDGYNYNRYYFFVTPAYGYNNKGYGIVRVLESTIKQALEKGDFELVNEFNEINKEVQSFFDSNFHIVDTDTSKCYFASDDEIRVAKMRLDKSVSPLDLQIQSALHNGIIGIKELENIDDFPAIKKALRDYPIHPVELLYKWYQNGNWNALFKFSVDYKEWRLSDALLQQNTEEIESIILRYWTVDELPYPLKPLDINKDELYVERNEIIYRIGSRKQQNIKEIIEYLNNVRNRIINEWEAKFDKEKLVGELTKDYFCAELSKGNREIVIIKLCVRLEAVLKCDYHCEGDFSEMLSHFCNRMETYYDEDGYPYPTDIAKLLNDLRKQRNGIVHSEKAAESMSDEELEQCIDYICSL